MRHCTTLARRTNGSTIDELLISRDDDCVFCLNFIHETQHVVGPNKVSLARSGALQQDGCTILGLLSPVLNTKPRLSCSLYSVIYNINSGAVHRFLPCLYQGARRHTQRQTNYCH